MAEPLHAGEPLERWSTDGRFGIRVEASALSDMLRCCRQHRLNETGGVLVGKYSPDHRLAVVTAVSRPTSDTKAGGYWLVRGIAGLASWLEELWSKGGGYYLGEWHYHPLSSPTPSGQDRKQLAQIARSPRYHCETPLLMIIGGDPAKDSAAHVEVFLRNGQSFVLVEPSLTRPCPALDLRG